jgi:hypothetical protein
MVGKEPAAGATRLEPGPGERLLIVVGLPVLGVLVGAALPVVARWALDLSRGLPFRFVFRVVGAVDRPWEIAVNLAIWLVVGVAVAYTALGETVRLTVTDDALRVEQRDRDETIGRADVADVFLDGDRIVVLDHRSLPLTRDPNPTGRDRVAAAFRAHGYPWRERDPFAGSYHRWRPDSPDLPAPVNAVLAAREVALRKKARTEVRGLSEALHKLGYATRDEGTRQFWRPLVPS